MQNAFPIHTKTPTAVLGAGITIRKDTYFMNIFEELTQILSKQLRVEVESIERSADIMEDLGADSLDIVEILMVVEEQFSVAVPEEEFPNLRTVGDLCDYIEANR